MNAPEHFKTNDTSTHYEAHITWRSGKQEIVKDWGLRSFWIYVASMRQWTDEIAEVVPYEIRIIRSAMTEPRARSTAE